MVYLWPVFFTVTKLSTLCKRTFEILNMIKYIVIPVFVILSFAVSFCNGQNVNDTIQEFSKDYTLLIYGMPNGGIYPNAKHIVAEKWGIQFIRVGDCVVSKALRDSASAHNLIANKNIEEKFGKEWRTEFDKQVDKEYKRQNKVTRIVNSDDLIKKKQNEMRYKDGLEYELQPIDGTTEYYVWINGWGKLNDVDDYISYYKLKVNYKTKKVLLVSDVLESRKHPSLNNY